MPYCLPPEKWNNYWVIYAVRKMQPTYYSNSLFEAIWYTFLLIIVLWMIHLLQLTTDYPMYQLGILPGQLSGLKGILFSPLLHSTHDFWHIINNTYPLFILLSLTIYFYREIALKVLLISWFGSGILVWAFATHNGAYHIGISGIIYALAAFLFVSGALRKYLPLQAISLFIVFLYGSMVWGIFPTSEPVSWEGHLAGMITGVALAYKYRQTGPQAPKYQYEIEKELGIEPIDFEQEIREYREKEAERIAEEQRIKRDEELFNQQQFVVRYHYIPKKPAGDSSEKS